MERIIELAKVDKCCGCAACYNACPVDAIQMEAALSGFLYPRIDVNKCLYCGTCQKVCPVLNHISREELTQPKACLIQHTNEDVRRESTSGGAFTAIAEVIINKGGVVFGAAFGDDFVVRHQYVEKENELGIFRNSKYVQSEIGQSYRKVKEFLNDNRWVLFSGTPCQIHGLLHFLGKKFDRLVTVDIVCHSVPSPAVFAKYMELQLSKFPDTQKIVFRDKSRGYDYSTMALYSYDAKGKEKCLYRKGSESDLWFRSFLPGLCDRENCYQCEYQEYPRVSDITIWDCFTVKKLFADFDDNKGTTSVAIWSQLGESILSDSSSIRRHDLDINVFVNKINREKDKKLAINRGQMYDDLQILSAQDFFDKYRKSSIKIKIKGLARSVLYYTRLQSIVKRIVNSIGENNE